MSLYKKFSDEASFRKDFVKPLLNRLGFFLVAEYHGRREFGKDFVFSELHRFGGVRHYAAQVKHVRTIGLGRAVDDLLTQTNQAFANPFTLPDSQEEAYISAFYIFNSGNITFEAKDDFIHRLRRTPYRGNVYLLEGERLDSLNKWATFQSDQDIRKRLLGLRKQLLLNINIWDSVKKFAEKGEFVETRRSFLSGIEGFLSAPIFPRRISENEIMKIWQRAQIIDSICIRHYMVGARDDIKKQEIKTLIQLVDMSTISAQKLISDIDGVISELKPL